MNVLAQLSPALGRKRRPSGTKRGRDHGASDRFCSRSVPLPERVAHLQIDTAIVASLMLIGEKIGRGREGEPGEIANRVVVLMMREADQTGMRAGPSGGARERPHIAWRGNIVD